MIVGITNPDAWQTIFEPTAAPARGTRLADPRTYYERHVMVEEALVENGVPRVDAREAGGTHADDRRRPEWTG
ncbi:MAG TPA: hypothetical protein VLW53_23890 [Candidatus Eisenbacteria bacterium]|nr:hypothetical protein [Candidatus Eisenbacteria bacterium]